MELTSLKIENFGSIGDITLPLNKPGLILVTGVNKDNPTADSNGSGKSLIFEAICWCLWGETVRGLSADEVVNTRAGKDCAVALTLTEHGRTYVVSRHRLDTRTRKPNDLVVKVNGLPLGTTGKMSSMQEVVNQLIGFNFDTFRAMMPGAGIKVANMTDKAIKELLESLLQTEQLSQAHEASRVKLKALEGSIVAHTGHITQCRQHLAALNTDIDNLRNMLEQSRLRTQQARAGHETRIQELTSELKGFTTQLAAEQDLVNEHFDYRTRANKLETEIETEYLAPLNTALSRKDAKIRDEHIALAVIQSQKDKVQDELDQADQLTSTCDHCFQAVPEDHISEVKSRLSASLADLSKKMEQSRGNVSVLKDEKRSLELDTMTTVTEMRDRAQQLRFAESAVKSKLDKLLTVKQLHTRTTADLAREQAALAKLDTEGTIESHDFDAMIVKKEALVQKTEETVQTHEAEIAKAEHEAKLCGFWVSGFSPAGLRSFMLDYVTPILNDRAKYYSSLLTNGEMTINFSTKSTLKSGSEKEKFSITCQQAHGSDSYRGSSTGERARADLVIAMSLGDLAQFRTAKQLPWRFLDEPFESIDRSGTEAIVRLLNDQKSRYRTVFVVTHKADFKELFSQQITIVKENGISSLG